MGFLDLMILYIGMWIMKKLHHQPPVLYGFKSALAIIKKYKLGAMCPFSWKR